MTRHFNDPEARAEWSERFGDPVQQGIHETYMRPQPCVAPDGCDMDLQTALAVADKYSKKGSGIGCLHSWAYRILALEIRRIHNAEASEPGAEDPDAALLESLTYWPSPEQNNEKESQ